MSIKKFKEEQKERAAELRRLKSHRPLSNRGDWDIYSLDARIRGLKCEYRHRHIAYCELRGTPYEAIERDCRTSPDRDWIERIKATYATEEEVAA